MAKDVNLLTLSSYSIIKSKLTKKPYMDDKFMCFLFATKMEADKFVEEHKDTYTENPEYYTEQVFYTEFFSYGIQGAHVKPAGKSVIDLEFTREDAGKQFYNEVSNRNLYMAKQTKDKDYLRELKDLGFFLVPTSIEIRAKKRYPKIRYCVLENSGSPKLVLFTTIKEFDIWNKEKQKNKWAPYKVDYPKLEKIRKGKSVIINPMSDKIILNNKQLAIIRTESPNKFHEE